MIRARGRLEPTRVIDITYEDLVARPSEEIRRVYRELGLSFSAEAAAFAESLPWTPINAVTVPKAEKWRGQNPGEILRILPLVSATERRLGYRSNSVSGPAQG